MFLITDNSINHIELYNTIRQQSCFEGLNTLQYKPVICNNTNRITYGIDEFSDYFHDDDDDSDDYEYHRYKGTMLHHIVHSNIPIINLPYAVSILRACGFDFERINDSCGYSAYMCLSMHKYYGYLIFQDIEEITKQLKNTIL